MNKKFTAIIICLVLLTGIYMYAKTDVLDGFLPESIRQEREKRQLENLLPDVIGEYVLIPQGTVDGLRRAKVITECERVPDMPDDVSGFCNQALEAQYREEKTSKTIFVNLVKTLEGGDMFKNYLTKVAAQGELDGYKVFSLEAHELGWFPVSGQFDIVYTQEGVWHPAADGGGSMSYIEKADGKNPVTDYLLKMYPVTKK